VRDQTWTEEGAYEVSAGVFRIPLPLPMDALRAVNVYAVIDGDRLVLVDGGWALQESQDQLARSLAKIGFGLADIREFLVTHIHRDHFTQAIAIRRLHGSRVALGEGERPSLEEMIASLERGKWDYTAAGRLTRAGAPDVRAQMIDAISKETVDPYNELPDTWLESDTVVELASRSLLVVATPGHTAGHVVFYDEGAKALFAGDHVLPHITPSIGLESNPTRMPLGDYLSSLALVRAMPDARLLPAHGPVTASVHARVDELLVHHEQRFAETMIAIDKGAQTAAEVAQILRWTRHARHLDELDLMNTAMAVAETHAHLDVLVARGQLKSTRDADGADHFSE
jgi:glyoxylase-like metal-dependent hydrolase (beta-lactamase superfamily II)